MSVFCMCCADAGDPRYAPLARRHRRRGSHAPAPQLRHRPRGAPHSSVAHSAICPVSAARLTLFDPLWQDRFVVPNLPEDEASWLRRARRPRCRHSNATANATAAVIKRRSHTTPYPRACLPSPPAHAWSRMPSVLELLQLLFVNHESAMAFLQEDAPMCACVYDPSLPHPSFI